MKTDAITARLRAAGCVFAEEEAAILAGTARTPAELDAMVARRAAGEPLEQVVGWAEFCGLRVFVDPGVFVPRRRSEFLVSVALGFARERLPGGQAVQEARADDALVIVDLCCGTGALGLAAAAGLAVSAGPGGPDTPGPAQEVPLLAGVELYAADLDPAAVACARRNVEPPGGHVSAGDLFAALPDSVRGRISVLICNAPYVPAAEIAFMPAEAREHEARIALDGGTDGLAILRRVAAGAGSWLTPGGVLLVETSARQAPSMAAAMTAAGLAARVHEDDDSGATVITGVLPFDPPDGANRR